MLIDDLINYVKENNIKYIFCDMDGCIAEFSHNKKVNVEKWLEHGLFINRRPLVSVINKLRVLKKSCNCKIIILSASPNNIASNEKIEWLKKYVDFIDIKNDVYLIGNSQHKVNAMNEIVEKIFYYDKKLGNKIRFDSKNFSYYTIETDVYCEVIKFIKKEDCLLIEDTHSILFEAEKQGYNCMHISSLVD